YSASDLFPNPATGNPGIKFVQDVTSLIICHPNYVPMILTIISPTNWTLTAITFGPSIPAPTNLNFSATFGTSGLWAYSYLVTAVDVNGQESGPSIPYTTTDNQPLINATVGTITITWDAVPG